MAHKKVRTISQGLFDRWSAVERVEVFNDDNHRLSLMTAFSRSMSAGRVVYVMADSFAYYEKYIKACALDASDFRYLYAASSIRGRHTVIIRTGAFWDRPDRDEIDRKFRLITALVYDDWAPELAEEVTKL